MKGEQTTFLIFVALRFWEEFVIFLCIVLTKMNSQTVKKPSCKLKTKKSFLKIAFVWDEVDEETSSKHMFMRFA